MTQSLATEQATQAMSAFEGINSDFLKTDQMLKVEDRALLLKIRQFVDDDVLPIINAAWEEADFPYQLLPKIAELGIIGTSIKGYGAAGLTRTQAGLVAMELSRGDGSLNTFNAVHSGLAMGTINLHGSEEQKDRWLPAMSKLELLGAFALTEPEHGSDTVALETSARREGDTWILNGAKRWIGLGHVADLVIVWARDEADGKVKAFVVEKRDGTYPEGYHGEAITGKIAKRGIQQAAITLENVHVPEANRLEKAHGFRAVTAVLNTTRTTVGWEALGHAQACYELAVQYTTQRKQFGRPINHNQLVQNKLATMLADLTAMQLMCFRCGQLQDAGDLTQQQASLQKMFVSEKSRELCRDARDLMGGNGLLLENHVARHVLDMEVVHTYEGTHFIQSLILGREITGHNAIS